MKVLLLGKNGQVGWELQRSLVPLGELVSCGRDEADFDNPGSLRALVRKHAPNVIVNAAAYTYVDRAESDIENARRVNTESVAVLAEEANVLDAWLIHYSTDYVFDGRKVGSYSEEDVTSPRSIYGQTKLDGELAIELSGCRYLIFRTSWVYAAKGNNFAKTMLKLAQERDELRVVSDQVGAPTSAELIADVTALILSKFGSDELRPNASGIYHLVADGQTSWHGFAQLVISEAQRSGLQVRVQPENVVSISTSEYPLPAARPENSSLSTEKLRKTFGLTLPMWQYHVKRMIAEII